MTQLQGDRVVVRPLAASDIPAVLAYRNDPEVARYQGWPLPFTAGQAAELTHTGNLGDPGWVQRGIQLVGGPLVGDVGVRAVDGQAELGITVAPGSQGRGYATEALGLVLDHLFGTLGLHRVFADVDPRNRAVLKLLSGLGFRYEGTRVAAFPGREGWTDSGELGLLATEWAQRAAARTGEVFLIGGGRDREALAAAHAGLADALGERTLLCVAADDGDGIDTDRWRGILNDAGVSSFDVLRIAADRLPTAADLAGIGGLYVAGGLTPLYARLLAPLQAALPPGIVYAGFSAGAAIAAGSALVGGWLLQGRAVCPEDAAEDLEEVAVVPGLGLVPFAVEVHATQWGTLGRAVNAVSAGLIDQAWALDENTGLRFADGRVRGVQGAGRGYWITRSGGGVRVETGTA